MAKLKMKGLDEYEKQLTKLQDISRECVGQAIYQGAKEIADEVKRNIEALPIDQRKPKPGQVLHGVTASQKQGLRDGFGIARIQNDSGYVHVKLGFAGYNSTITDKYPNGQPNSMIARSLQSGTSFRARIPFVDNAVSAKKSACEQKMIETFDKVLAKEMR